MSRIWIDLDNSPHVPFFAPIIRELKKRNHTVILSARDCFQVFGLADLHGFQYRKIGKHYGKHLLLKIFGTVYRSFQLLGIGIRANADIAVSHGSRSQLIASKFLMIPSVLIYDYEHSSGLRFIHPNYCVSPELIGENGKSNGSCRIYTYPGIKEDVYVPDFVPDSRIKQKLGNDEKNILVTIRPPASEAHYRNPESETLFQRVIDFLGSMNSVTMVILPRNEKKQTDFIKARWADWCKEGKIIIPEKVVNGLNLIWHSDLVISGGGTMNREAAALDVPVYSIFRGKIGAVDRYLEKNGRLTLLETSEDIQTKISVTKRNKNKEAAQKDRKALMSIVDTLEECLDKSG